MRKDLPPRYYLTHFHEFLGFFEGASRALLSDEATDFVRRFKALDDDKQCIVVRAANRKYAVIDRTQFNYNEIAVPQEQIDWLTDNGAYFGESDRSFRFYPITFSSSFSSLPVLP